MQRTLSLLLVFLLTQWAFAQLSTKVEFNSYADDNLFRSPQPISDILNNAGIKIDYQLNDSDFKFYYAGNFFFYRDYSERNFVLQSLGLNAFHAFGSDKQHGFYYGADFALRINGQQYDYYNYNQLYAYANFNFDLNFLFFKTGYNFRYRGYSNLSDLTNYRHYLFAQVNKSFPTKTTIILEADWGRKAFSGSVLSPAPVADEGGMWGHGHGRRWQETPLPSQLSVPSMSHVVLLARVAQSLHPKVGVYVQYRKQISLTSQTDYINSSGYYQDEELFDDPFSYESDGISSQLTWVLPWQAKLQIGGGALQKNYVSEQAFLSQSDTVGLGGLRKDTNRNFFVLFKKTFYFNKRFMDALEFNVNYNYIYNKSNSYWYDYRNSIVGGGISWQF